MNVDISAIAIILSVVGVGVALARMIQSLRADMHPEMDLRFVHVAQRFAQIDQRFAEVDRRFTEVDQRISSCARCDKNVREEVSHLREEMGTLRERTMQPAPA